MVLSQHHFALRDNGHETSASRGVSVYVTAIAGTYCAYPRRDGQAELTWVYNFSSVFMRTEVSLKLPLR